MQFCDIYYCRAEIRNRVDFFYLDLDVEKARRTLAHINLTSAINNPWEQSKSVEYHLTILVPEVKYSRENVSITQLLVH